MLAFRQAIYQLHLGIKKDFTQQKYIHYSLFAAVNGRALFLRRYSRLKKYDTKAL